MNLFCSISYGQHRTISTDNPKLSALDKQVDKYVTQYYQDKRSVGVSIGIVKGGNIYFYNYGETQAGNKLRPDKNTIYEIGSTTKSFTGILLGQAITDHKIGLDNDIRDYLKGEFPNLVYQGTPITIRNLASHTSRITRIFPNMWERPEYDSLNPLKNYNKALLYQGLHKMQMDTLPGKKYAYSNMAVALLGTILEDAYGKDYFTLIQKYILTPLQMDNTMIRIDALPARRIAHPHDENRKPVPMWDIFYVPAMGALRSTTTDMVKYIIANNNEANAAIKLSHQRIFGTDEDGMGLNWFLHRTPTGHRVLEHSGGTGGSRSSLECFPELKTGFVILTNSLANRNQLEKDLASLLSK
ncbi:serine hydrolase domain-containing protein [Mucilaginibacter auburnensis]|nr:serine hydrolase domain-containing protein [Mucilaginibacter auburnensis]